MKRKDPRGHAGPGITVPDFSDSAPEMHFLAALRATVGA